MGSGENRRSGKDLQQVARNWYATFITLAGQDPLKIEEATNLNIRAAFNWLAWKTDQIKKQELKDQKEKSIRR